MSIDLEERLRRAGRLLDEQATHAPVGDVAQLVPLAERPDRRWAVRLGVAAIAVAGLAGLVFAVSREPNSSSFSNTPDSTNEESSDAASAVSVGTTVAPPLDLVPFVTLPPSSDVRDVVPPTVVAAGPTDWYRLQPDLDVAWYSDAAGTASMLCFRTPLGPECQLDEFGPSEFGGGPIGVYTTGDQLIVLTLDSTSRVTVRFDDDRIATVVAQPDPQIGWGVGRLQLPPGVSPVGLSMEFGREFATSSTGPGSIPPDDGVAVGTSPASTEP